jgi:hypothetical protein
MFPGRIGPPVIFACGVKSCGTPTELCLSSKSVICIKNLVELDVFTCINCTNMQTDRLLRKTKVDLPH